MSDPQTHKYDGVLYYGLPERQARETNSSEILCAPCPYSDADSASRCPTYGNVGHCFSGSGDSIIWATKENYDKRRLEYLVLRLEGVV